MESPGKSIKEVTSLFHIGIAVWDLANLVRVFEKFFDFKLVSSRTVAHEYLGELIGVPEASAEITMLDIGDGKLLELISWSNDTFIPSISDLSTAGVHHICVYVESADELFKKISNIPEIRLISKNPVVVPVGPNTGCKVFFALVLGQIYVEVFERVD